MYLERWQDWYEHVVLPYVFAFSIATVGVAIGFIYPLLTNGQGVTATGLATRWLGVAAGLFGGAAAVWWLLVEDSTRRLVLGTVLLGLITLVEAIGGGWLVLQSDLATSVLALVAAALTAVSLVLMVASLAVVLWARLRYGVRLLLMHALLVLAVPVALVLADRALPFEPDPVIGLVFVIVPFIAALHVANGLLIRIWLAHDPHPIHRPVRGI